MAGWLVRVKRLRRKSPRRGLDRAARKADARLMRKVRGQFYNGAFVRPRDSAAEVRAARRLAEAGRVYAVSTKWDDLLGTGLRELWVTESWRERLRYLTPLLPGRRAKGLEP